MLFFSTGMSKQHQGLQGLLKAALSAAVPIAALSLSGCGSGANQQAPPSSVAITGRVYAGQQAVSGATITLYSAGLSGTGTGAVNLLGSNSVTTDSSGNFSIPSTSYTCPSSNPPVYLVAQGGSPAAATGSRNSALELVAAVGNCGDFSSAFTQINEVTTAAAAWSLSQFFGSNAQAGANATNIVGLRNAFAVAGVLSNTKTGTAPGASLPTGATVESSKLNTLANILAKCANSNGPNCGALFVATTIAGIAPQNTFDAALTIVRYPGRNVAGVFASATGTPVFSPALSVAPNDWTMSIQYGGCTTGCGGLNLPGGLALDSLGDVWVANYFGGVVSKFSPTGVPASPQGFAGVGLYQSYGITVDGSDNAWVANEQSVSAANNKRLGSISKFNSSGTELSANGYTDGAIYYPLAVAATPTGSIWVADYGSSSATLLSSSGTSASGSGGYASSQLPFTSAVAVDAAQNAWFAHQKGIARVTPQGVVSVFSCCTDPEGIAIAPSGNIWVADYGAFSIEELSSSGQLLATVSTAGGGLSPQGIAIDSAGNVWASNYIGNSITALNGSTAALQSPATGFGQDAKLNEPYSIAIDASGNLWLSNSGDSTLTEIVGLAAPVKTPLLGPPSQP